MKICVSRDPASFLFLAAKEKLFFENQNLKVEILEKDAETSFVFLKNQRVDCAILPFSTFLEEYSKSLSFDILPGFHVCSSPLHIFHLNKENLINLHSENSYIAIPSENSLEELYARSILELLFSKNEEFPAIRVAQFEPEEELQQKGCIGYALNPIQHPISGKWKILEQEISGQISKKMPALSKFYPLYCTAFSANFLSQNAEELNPFISALKDCLKFLSSLEEGAIFSFIQSLKQKDHFAHFNFRELKHWFSDKNKVFKNLLNFQADRSHYKNLTQLQTSKNNLSSHKKNIEKLYVIFNGNYREPNLIKKQLVSSGNRNKLSNKKNLPEKHEYIHALLDLIEEKPIESSKVNADFKQLLKELSLDKKNQIQKAEKLSAKLTELKNKLFERDKKRVKKNTAFLTLLSLSSEPLLLIDVEYDKFIIYNYNSKFAEAIGYSETELLGKPFLYILRKPLRLKELKDSILDREGLFLEEVSLKHRSFPSIEVDLSLRLVSFEGKDFLLAKVHLNSKEKDLLKFKQQLVSNISHDLRSPLTNIKGFMELLTRDEKLNISKEHIETFSVIFKNIQKLEKNINRLMETTTKQEKVDEMFDPALVIEEVIKENRKNAENKNLDIDSNLSSGLSIQLNKMDFYRAINNLVVNAIKYTKEGKISVSMEEEVNRLCLIKITDTGIGIDPQYAESIFDRFFRVPDHVQEASGKGLGLSIAQQIIFNSGGQILLDSEYKKGTRFLIYFPLVRS